MTVPVVRQTSEWPRKNEGRADFTAKADQLGSTLPLTIDDINSAVQWVNGKSLEVAEARQVAATAAGEAASSADGAAESAARAAAAAENLAELDALWLGPLPADPATGKGGAPLVAGNAYINTVTGYIRAYNGTEWVQGVSAVAGVASIAGLVGPLTLEQLGGAGIRVDEKLQTATEDEMRAGTEVALREMSPAGVREAVMARAEELAGILPQYLPEAVAPGTTVLSVNKLPEPDWLTHGVPYLAAAYPESAKRLSRRPYSVAAGSLALGVNTSGAYSESVAVSADAGVVVFTAYEGWLHTVFVAEDGALSAGTPYRLADVQNSQSWSRMAITPDGQYLLVSYDVRYNGTGASGVDILKRSGNGWAKAASVVPKSTSAAYYYGVAISDDGSRIWVSSKFYEATVPAFKEYAHNLVTQEITDLGAPAAQMPPVTGRVSVMHYYAGKLFVLWSGAATGVADSAVYDTEAGFAVVAQPYKTGATQQWSKLAVSSDRSAILFGGVAPSAYSYHTFDMASLKAVVSDTRSYPPNTAYLPGDDAMVFTTYNGSQGSVTSERSAVTGAAFYYNNYYTNFTTSVAVNIGRGLVAAIHSNGSVGSYKREPTFTLAPWGVFTSAGNAVPPAYPHYLFTRSLD